MELPSCAGIALWRGAGGVWEGEADPGRAECLPGEQQTAKLLQIWVLQHLREPGLVWISQGSHSGNKGAAKSTSGTEGCREIGCPGVQDFSSGEGKLSSAECVPLIPKPIPWAQPCPRSPTAFGEQPWSLGMQGWAPSIPAASSSRQQLLPCPHPRDRLGPERGWEPPTAAVPYTTGKRWGGAWGSHPGRGGGAGVRGSHLGRGCRDVGIPLWEGVQGCGGPTRGGEGVQGLAALNSNTNCPSVPLELSPP